MGKENDNLEQLVSRLWDLQKKGSTLSHNLSEDFFYEFDQYEDAIYGAYTQYKEKGKIKQNIFLRKSFYAMNKDYIEKILRKTDSNIYERILLLEKMRNLIYKKLKQ